jgi:signal transduction histidine kinase
MPFRSGPQIPRASRRVAVLLPPLVIAVVAAVVISAVLARRQVTDASRETQERITLLQRLATRLVDAETGQRGYIITGEAIYLEPYFGAAADARAMLHDLQDRLDDTGQRSRLAQLEDLVERRFTVLDQVIETRRSEGLDAARDAILQGAGREVMSEIRLVAGAVIAAEAARLDALLVREARRNLAVLWLVVIGSILIALAALLTRVVFARHLALQQRLNDELTDANGKLQDQAIELESQSSELQEQTFHLEDTAAELEAANAELEVQRSRLERSADELETANAELRMLNRALQERTLQAESANRSKADFLAAMSHELRTPLNAITGYVDLLHLDVYGPSNEAQKVAMERIRSNASHLLVLINDILHFAKIKAGRVQLARAAVPLRQLVSDTEQAVSPLVQAKGLTLRADSGLDVPVMGDPDRIRQILLNLLSNAVKYTDSGGSVVLSADVDGERVSIRVRDSGWGIPREMLETIFDPFVQLNRGAGGSLNDGVGLGLSISRDLARAMDGDLVVDSEPGGGSTFTLTLRRSGTGAA